MTDRDKIIITRIKQNKTINEIAQEIGISNKQLYDRILALKNKGFVLIRNITDNGDILYSFKNEPQEELICTQKLKLAAPNSFSAMLISDTHIGNELQNIKLLDKIYNYCQKQDIHIIINCGDLIDGNFSYGNQITADPIVQLDTLIKSYPFDKEILNIMCLGNHDYSAFKSCVDAKTLLENARPDFIPLGYGIGIINVESDQIILKHNINEFDFKPTGNKLVLEGHHHKASFINNRDGFIVNIPTLSKLSLGKHPFPGAIKMKLSFNIEGYINSGYFEQFIITNDLITVNEAYFNFDFDHEILSESSVKPKIKAKINKPAFSRQIEKFNRKWKRN